MSHRVVPLDPDHVATLAWEQIHELRWWSAEELRAAGAVTAPRRLAGILDDLREGHVPDADAELGAQGGSGGRTRRCGHVR